MARVPSDVVLLPEADGRWVAVNVFARTALGIGAEVVSLLESAQRGEEPSAGEFRVWEVERFSHLDGLLADPSRFVRDVAAWPPPEHLDARAALDRLRTRYLVVDDEDAYRSRFGPMTSLLDGDHFGTFHQQLGRELLVTRRESPSAWWLRQKFTDDVRGLRETLYKSVQLPALERFFGERVEPGTRVLDLGCGPGFYANLIAARGAEVYGVDPSEEYIALARERALPGTRFEQADVGLEGALDLIPDGWADLVLMSDALLFYFVPVNPSEGPADLEVLKRDLRRILKPSGTFVSVEPHSVFFLAPWLGDVDRPFTVLTEYETRTFGITPALGRLLGAFLGDGFALVRFEELLPAESFREADARAYHFAREFPLWHLAEFVRSPAGD